MPHELSLMGVSFSPFLPVLLGGLASGGLVFGLLVRLSLSRYFANPPWVFLALVTIATCLLASFWTVV